MANSNKFTLAKLFPFFISKNLYLYMSFDIINLLDNTIYKWINKKKTINIFEII